MHISSLRLYQFRNLKDQEITFAPGVNFLFGQNGQGKSNFVEAVSVLANGRSFRTSHLRELIAWGCSEASVFAKLSNNSSSFELGVAITTESRIAYLNGEKIDSVGAFLGKLIAVTFSPTDLSLVRGAPQERRRFLDKHLVDFRPALIPVIVDYQRALKSKNALLKAGIADQRQLGVWNQILAERGLEIFGARQEFLRQLEDRAANLYHAFSSLDGDLELRLRTNIGADEHESLTVAAIMERFHQMQERELQQGSTLIGPHRDDVIVELGGKSARAFASQGQARSIVLALKLAVIELIEERREESPVVLLDDVESELDPLRRRALIDLIFGRPRQVFLTGTEIPRDIALESESSKCLHIEAGQLALEKVAQIFEEHSKISNA